MLETPRSASDISAYCYLYKEGDKSNWCQFSENGLKVVHHGITHYFESDHIQNISFESRKLMLPLIIGGTSTAFILIAMLKNLFNPWLLLILLSIGLVLTYYGWSGSNVMIIKEKGNQNDFLLKHVSIHVKQFVRYINKKLRVQRGQLTKKEILIYHICLPGDWQEAVEKGIYELKETNTEGFLHASDYEQVINSANLYFEDHDEVVLMVLDPELLRSPIKYELAVERGLLFPHIFGDINLEAVLTAPRMLKDSFGNFLFPDLDLSQNT